MTALRNGGGYLRARPLPFRRVAQRIRREGDGEEEHKGRSAEHPALICMMPSTSDSAPLSHAERRSAGVARRKPCISSSNAARTSSPPTRGSSGASGHRGASNASVSSTQAKAVNSSCWRRSCRGGRAVLPDLRCVAYRTVLFNGSLRTCALKPPSPCWLFPSPFDIHSDPAAHRERQRLAH